MKNIESYNENVIKILQENGYGLQDESARRFFQLDKSLFQNPHYEGLSLGAKSLYAILVDRFQLSRKNKWFDDYGIIYLNFKNQDLTKLADISIPTVVSYKKQLKKYGLITEIRMGQKKVNRIYPLKVKPRPVEIERLLDEDGILRDEVQKVSAKSLQNVSAKSSQKVCKKSEVKKFNFKENQVKLKNLTSEKPQENQVKLKNLISEKNGVKLKNLTQSDTYSLKDKREEEDIYKSDFENLQNPHPLDLDPFLILKQSMNERGYSKNIQTRVIKILQENDYLPDPFNLAHYREYFYRLQLDMKEKDIRNISNYLATCLLNDWELKKMKNKIPPIYDKNENKGINPSPPLPVPIDKFPFYNWLEGE